MLLTLKTFSAMLPGVDNWLLEDNAAELAVNVDLATGVLDGMRTPLLHHTLPTPPLGIGGVPGAPWAHVARIEDAGAEWWFTSQAVRYDVVRSGLANETDPRWYIAETNQPVRYTSKARLVAVAAPLELGMPGELAIPTVSTPGVGTTVTRAYTYTLVSRYGEESAPAEPLLCTSLAGTFIIDIPNQAINMANRDITGFRVYRTITGIAGGTTYFRISNAIYPLFADGTSGSVFDTFSDRAVATRPMLESVGWLPPPAGLVGILMHPGGFLVGFLRNEIYMSVPYRAHAWPVANIVTVEHPIVGLAIIDGTVLVMTEGYPVALIGSTPAGMRPVRAAAVEPCLSHRSIVSSTAGVLYASPNGLIFYDGQDTQVASAHALTREQWLRLGPAGISAASRGDAYVAFTGVGSGFVVVNNSNTPFLFFEDMVGARYISQDALTDNLYLQDNEKVYLWDPEEQPRMPYLWRSKEFKFSRPLNFAAGYLFLDLGPAALPVAEVDPLEPTQWASYWFAQDPALPIALTPPTLVGLRIWADGRLVLQRSLTGNGFFRLPEGFKAERWKFELVGRTKVKGLAIASTAKELEDV